ncbi:hypothetical protein BGW42_007145 [Actinomortierella wolfii]|nr:hypothetical protein BGW42_007145 [Actinomortierella wolfii]
MSITAYQLKPDSLTSFSNHKGSPLTEAEKHSYMSKRRTDEPLARHPSTSRGDRGEQNQLKFLGQQQRKRVMPRPPPSSSSPSVPRVKLGNTKPLLRPSKAKYPVGYDPSDAFDNLGNTGPSSKWWSGDFEPDRSVDNHQSPNAVSIQTSTAEMSGQFIEEEGQSSPINNSLQNTVQQPGTTTTTTMGIDHEGDMEMIQELNKVNGDEMEQRRVCNLGEETSKTTPHVVPINKMVQPSSLPHLTAMASVQEQHATHSIKMPTLQSTRLAVNTHDSEQAKPSTCHEFEMPDHKGIRRNDDDSGMAVTHAHESYPQVSLESKSSIKGGLSSATLIDVEDTLEQCFEPSQVRSSAANQGDILDSIIELQVAHTLAPPLICMPDTSLSLQTPEAGNPNDPKTLSVESTTGPQPVETGTRPAFDQPSHPTIPIKQLSATVKEVPTVATDCVPKRLLTLEDSIWVKDKHSVSQSPKSPQLHPQIHIVPEEPRPIQAEWQQWQAQLLHHQIPLYPGYTLYTHTGIWMNAYQRWPLMMCRGCQYRSLQLHQYQPQQCSTHILYPSPEMSLIMDSGQDHAQDPHCDNCEPHCHVFLKASPTQTAATTEMATVMPQPASAVSTAAAAAPAASAASPIDGTSGGKTETPQSSNKINRYSLDFLMRFSNVTTAPPQLQMLNQMLEKSQLTEVGQRDPIGDSEDKGDFTASAPDDCNQSGTKHMVSESSTRCRGYIRQPKGPSSPTQKGFSDREKH